MNSMEPFKIELHDISFEVTQHRIGKSEVFRLVFSDQRPPLNLTEAKGLRPFWTSVPQGRQIEAEFFGNRITEYLKNKN